MEIPATLPSPVSRSPSRPTSRRVIDYKTRSSDVLTGSYVFDGAQTTQPDQFNLRINEITTQRNLFSFQETHTFAHNLVNSARFGGQPGCCGDWSDPHCIAADRKRTAVRATKAQTADRNFVQRLYSRFAFVAFLALLAFLEISNLRVLNTLHGFDSHRLHHFPPLTIYFYSSAE